MSPFANYFYQLRNKRRISQFAMAKLMGYAQGFISSIELGKKLPNDEFINKMIQVLDLDNSEANLAREYVRQSQRRYLLPADATIDQYQLVHDLWGNLNQLHHSQLQAIRHILAFPNSKWIESRTSRKETEREVPK